MNQCAALSSPGAPRLGLVIHSLWNRWQGDYSSAELPPLRSPLEVLDYCREEGFGALQTTVGGWSAELARQVREAVETSGMTLEGSIELPHDEADVARFEHEARRAREAGAEVFRSYLGGRRYEDLKDMGGVRNYREHAARRLRWAEPVLRKLGLRLGVENHKDFRAEELAELLRQVGSPHVGCCLDFGNNLALLERPEETLHTLAPWLLTTHLKDMAVAPAEQGFFLAEVPLGRGILDLPALIKSCQSANPRVGFNLEMITRDPLLIPCLEPSYWQVMAGVSGEALTSMLQHVGKHQAGQFERVGERTKEQLCQWEAEQNKACAEHAFAELGFARQGHGSGG